MIRERYLWEIYRECMEPYCMGQADYESCLTALKDRLTIYITA